MACFTRNTGNSFWFLDTSIIIHPSTRTIRRSEAFLHEECLPCKLRYGIAGIANWIKLIALIIPFLFLIFGQHHVDFLGSSHEGFEGFTQEMGTWKDWGLLETSWVALMSQSNDFLTLWLFRTKNGLPQEFPKCQKVSFWKRWDSNMTMRCGYLVDVSDTVPLPVFCFWSPVGSIWRKAKVVSESDQTLQLIWLFICVLRTMHTVQSIEGPKSSSIRN